MAPARVVEVLNAVEGAQAGIEAAISADRSGTLFGQSARAAILNNADEALSEARLTLREFVFGRVEPLADIRFDGPEQCAVMIDRDESDFYVDRSGVVRDSTGREVPKNAILTHGRRL
jgi:hypothetical protein